MFDGQPGTGHGIDPVSRLCRTYDPLLGNAPARLSAQDEVELAAMARIYDLDAERAPAAVWQDLRRVLVGQAVADLPGAAPFEPLTILVVEDDALTAAELVETLTDAGHRVIGPFQEAEAALVSAGLHPLDLALLDINLAGDGTGVELARRLRDSWGVPTVFLSGDVTRAARHADVATALVLKPYSAKQVLNAIASAAPRPATQPRPAPLI